MWALLSTVLRVAYDEETDETTAYGLINIGNLKCILEAAQSPTFILSLLSNVSASVVPWLSDDKRLLTDEEYNIAITPAYLAILSALERASDDKADILENYGELLAAISTRITPGAATFTAFVDFWQRVFGDHFDVERAPSSLRALLLISGCPVGSESPESQEQEEVPETPVHTTEETEWQEVSNTLEAFSDYDDSESPVVLRSPVVDQSKSLPVFEGTQTTEASDAGSSSDEGEEEIPVELPEPALIEKLLRLRKSLSPWMRRSQSRLPDVSISIPSIYEGTSLASYVTESPAKETQLEESANDQERRTPSPEDQVLEGLSSTPSSIKGHLLSPRSPSPVATIAMLSHGQSELSPSDSVNRLPTPTGLSPIRTPVVASDPHLSTMLGKKRGRENEKGQDTPLKKRKLTELLTPDKSPSSTNTEAASGVEDPVGVEKESVDVESQSTILESVPESVVLPTVSPKVATKETSGEAETPILRRIEKQAVSVSGRRSLLPTLRITLILLSATPLKRKRDIEEVSKSTTGMGNDCPPETRSPRYPFRALGHPSPSKRRRVETCSDSPALRVLLPSSDELSSSGMCFFIHLQCGRLTNSYRRCSTRRNLGIGRLDDDSRQSLPCCHRFAARRFR